MTFRARATAVSPDAYVRVFYPVKERPEEELTRVRPAVPGTPESGVMPGSAAKGAADVLTLLEEPAGRRPPVFVEEGSTYNHLWLRPGEWSPEARVADFGGWRQFYVRGLSPRDFKTPVAIEAVTLEFEVRAGGRTIATVSEPATSANGNRVMIFLPADLLRDREGRAVAPGPDFAASTYGLLDYAARRADRIEALPWAEGPLPRRYAILSTCGGWGRATSSQGVFVNEFRTLRQLGVNGIYYDTWPGVTNMIRTGEGPGSGFGRVAGHHLNHVSGVVSYGVPAFVNGNVTAEGIAAGVGCPHHPAHTNLRASVEAEVEKLAARLRETPVEEYWLKTVDELGSFFDGSAERKAHQGCCPFCREAFREFIRGFGLGPADFGATNWADIRSTFGYWAEPWEVQQGRKQAGDAALRERLETAARSTLEPGGADRGAADLAGDVLEESADAAPERAGDALGAGQPRPPLPDWGWALLTYYSRRFNNEDSARLFTPVRDAMRARNESKALALKEGRTDSPEARQPWMYAYALRGNTFLMGGHSLDFFDFYRHADNGFAYETSNRDPRAWEWDSYLCDVGRILQDKLGTRFSIMIKPGRGAIVQRTLTAVARKARMIDWYTYGPDWWNPDTFAHRFERLELVSRAAHMLGEAEAVTYDADWVFPAEVAVVRPLTSAVFENSASWENGKWIYEALTHAHFPVDPLDEGLLMTEDLSRYRAIYVSGSHIRRDVAVRLAQWVRDGGTLYASGWGMARDESDRPLDDVLLPVFGLERREPVELWSSVPRYGATELRAPEPLTNAPPGAAQVTGRGPLAGLSFPVVVGRERLVPGAEAGAVAVFGDGAAAVVIHRYGEGLACLAGFYAGLEYAADVMRPDYDMSTAFLDDKRRLIADPARRAGALPSVDAGHPLIEGALLRNPETGRRAVVLMNWAYRGRDLVPLADIKVAVRRGAPASRVRSLWLRQDVPFEAVGADLLVRLPRVEDGDILLLE